MGRSITQDHMTSLRLPQQWDLWVKQFAERWTTTPAYVYRRAIIEFIRKHGGQV